MNNNKVYYCMDGTTQEEDSMLTFFLYYAHFLLIGMAIGVVLGFYILKANFENHIQEDGYITINKVIYTVIKNN